MKENGQNLDQSNYFLSTNSTADPICNFFLAFSSFVLLNVVKSCILSDTSLLLLSLFVAVRDSQLWSIVCLLHFHFCCSAYVLYHDNNFVHYTVHFRSPSNSFVHFWIQVAPFLCDYFQVLKLFVSPQFFCRRCICLPFLLPVIAAVFVLSTFGQFFVPNFQVFSNVFLSFCDHSHTLNPRGKGVSSIATDQV